MNNNKETLKTSNKVTSSDNISGADLGFKSERKSLEDVGVNDNEETKMKNCDSDVASPMMMLEAEILTKRHFMKKSKVKVKKY